MKKLHYNKEDVEYIDGKRLYFDNKLTGKHPFQYYKIIKTELDDRPLYKRFFSKLFGIDIK